MYEAHKLFLFLLSCKPTLSKWNISGKPHHIIGHKSLATLITVGIFISFSSTQLDFDLSPVNRLVSVL
ncbi:hypothetical protein VNO78_20153 [Psophocarpus tetragonolobus]|uniref:Uncharacterized protein n=1 Tax=Psophocarpus tetragonolobus TaxID=3891 RepID=A0AAN9XH91_PSOTE